MKLYYLDALAGAGKTRALVREAHRLAQLGQRILFLQPTKLLIERTIATELVPLSPAYPFTALHGDVTGSVVRDLVAHFRQPPRGGEIVVTTHAAFERAPYFENRADWILIVDEGPQVDAYEEKNLPETHDLITAALRIEPYGAEYGLLLPRDPS